MWNMFKVNNPRFYTVNWSEIDPGPKFKIMMKFKKIFFCIFENFRHEFLELLYNRVIFQNDIRPSSEDILAMMEESKTAYLQSKTP